jgi:phenylacetate-CoA ligase
MPGIVDRVYGEVFRRVLQPVWETHIRGRPTLEYWRFLEKSQWFSRDELEAMQLAQIKKLLHHAWHHVPFYRKRMDQAGVGPDTLRTLDDLRRLPILTREQANADPEGRKSTAPPFATVRKVTSGSSGTPLTFGYDIDSDYWRVATKMRGYGWAGYRPGDVTVHFWGAVAKKTDLRTKLWVKTDRLIRREFMYDCGVRGERELLAVIELIKKHRPTMLICYTQAAADLARFVLERPHLRAWDTIPVLCGAERLFPADREIMEKAFGKGLFETYGSREVMLMGAETEAHEGLLVPMENVLVEVIVRTADGRERPAEPGETGEVVVTDLHNLGMPFIRYANGDLATMGPRKPSPCGRQHMRLAAIDGRVTETLTDAKGAPVNGLVFNVMFSTLGYSVRRFQAVQHKDRSVTLRVVPSDKFDADARKTIHDVAGKYLTGLPFKLEIVNDIPTSPSGKRHVVVVEK